MAKAAKKDSNKPKRGMTAYFLWMNENRDRIRKANPTAKITKISKIAGVEWKALADKSKWEKAAVADRKRYEEEMKSYVPAE